MSEEIMPPKMSLWDIESGWIELMQASLEAEQIEDPAERERAKAAVDTALSEYIAREVTKVDGIRAVCRSIRAAADAAKKERDYQDQRADALDAVLKRIKERAMDAMEAAGKTRIDGRTGYLIVKGNGGQVPVKVDAWDGKGWAGISVLPPEFRTVTVRIPASVLERLAGLSGVVIVSTEPNNSAIREALSRDEGVPGAHFGERGKHLEIK